MIRFKQLVDLAQNPNRFPSKSSSSSDNSCCSAESSLPFEIYWAIMVKRRREIIITPVMTLDIGPSGTLSLEDKSWKDTEYLFVRGENNMNKEHYFWDLSWANDNQQEFVHPDHYDKDQMDREFGHLPGSCSPPGPLRPVARIAKLEVVVKAVFHFDEGFERRLPGPAERIYHRRGDGYVSISLEHLRADFRPMSHHFLKALCKDEYQILVHHLVSNSVRWITWFIGCCNTTGYQPTFKLFHTLFKL